MAKDLTTPEKIAIPSKATKGASLKKLNRLCLEAVVKARKGNPTLSQLEEDATANLIELRELVGTELNGNRSVFGHMMHGMSGRLDMAFMQHDPTDFAAIMCEVASGDNHARRSAPTDYQKTIGHALDTLKRASGNGINSATKFAKTLASVGMDHKAEYICNLMSPVYALTSIYAANVE